MRTGTGKLMNLLANRRTHVIIIWEITELLQNLLGIIRPTKGDLMLMGGLHLNKDKSGGESSL